MTNREPSELSAVFARAQKVMPRVERAENPWVVPIGVLGAALLGATVFAGLSNGREVSAEIAAAPPPVVAPPVTESVPPAPPTSTPAPPAPAFVPQMLASPDPYEAHLRAPAVVFDTSSSGPAPVQVAQAAAAQPEPASEAAPAAAADANQLSADERFVARVTGAKANSVQAYRLGNLAYVVPQGTVIPAVLETALDSDLPGSVRGVVSRDVVSFDGVRTLIPRGSTLIGQYKSAVAEGQSRAFVIWSRVITPKGIAVEIGSPATDRLGRGGLDGDVDTHFLRRFGAAILLSVIDAGVTAAASNRNGNTNLIIASPTQANRIAEIALQRQIDIPPTIRVPQGAPVQVFVSRDLDFSNVLR